MDSGKREKVAYLAALVQRGELTCEEALAVSGETSGSFVARDLQLFVVLAH